MKLPRNLLISQIANAKGSLTLESTLLMPLIILLFLGFIQIYKIYEEQIALQSTTSEVVRELASKWSIAENTSKHIPNEWRSVFHLGTTYIDPKKALPIGTLLATYAEPPLQKGKIKVDTIHVPNHKDKIELVLSYRHKIILPFVSKNIVIRAKAAESIWR